jgi:hypothetical protein
MAPKRKPMKKTPSYARLDPFTRGMIWGMHIAGALNQTILKTVKKEDNTPVGKTAVKEVIAHMQQDPKWRGADPDTSNRGRPSALTDVDKQEIEDVVFEYKAKAVVNIKFIKRKIQRLRPLSRWCISRALRLAGLKWLRRRGKRALPKKHKKARLKYCDWILAQTQAFLNRFAYTDGTTFYLARTWAEHEDKQRAALGKFCWRMADGKDGLFDENVGPSMYAKAQGLPVKIWGLFANGRLEYFVLPTDGGPKAEAKAEAKAKAKAKAKGKAMKRRRRKTGTVNMTINRYVDLVDAQFQTWRKNCFQDNQIVHLYQDHEPCLWNEHSLAAIEKAGFSVLDSPINSPDLNAIEGWWNRIRMRLDETAPAHMETRSEFLARLRRTVHWLNEHAADDALKLARNQKERANRVKELKGARCQW